MKKLINLKILAVIVASMFFTGSMTFAHAPEWHIDQGICDAEKIVSSWIDENGNATCDPLNPPNILDGITHDDYPNGLCYPSFNNYTDSADVDVNNIPIGLDPPGSQPPIFEDERNFFQVRKKVANDVDNAQWSDYEDRLLADVEAGDELVFAMYIHNDGDPCLNDNVLDSGLRNALRGTPLANWQTTSYNTKIQVNPFFSLEDGELTRTVNGEAVFNGNIWSDNAIKAFGAPATQSAPTNDTVRISIKDGKTVKFKYVEGSARYIDYNMDYYTGIDRNGTEFSIHNINNASSLFSQNGYSLSTLIGGVIKRNDGDYYASEPYIGVVFFTVRVEGPPVCEDLTAGLVATNVTLPGIDGPLYKVNTTVTWSPAQVLENSRLVWESDDPNGIFHRKVGTNYLPGGSKVVLNLSDAIPTFNDLYYTGQGPITIKVVDKDDATERALTTSCQYRIPAIDKICENLTIEEGTQTHTLYGEDGIYLTPRVTFENGQEVPSETEIRWSTSNGKFLDLVGIFTGRITEIEDIFKQILPYQFDMPVFFTTETTTTINAEVIGFESICNDQLTITVEEESNVCEKLETSMYPVKDPQNTLTPGFPIAGVSVYNLRMDNVEFSGETPDPVLLHWFSTDANGQFWILKNGEWRATGIGSGTAGIHALSNVTVLYTGEGKINVGISKDAGFGSDEVKGCLDDYTIPDEPLVCKEIRVTYQDPILLGFYTEFTAVAIDQDGNEYEANIEYTANGGTVSEEKPTDTEKNPSPVKRNWVANQSYANNGFANLLAFSPTNLQVPTTSIQTPTISKNIQSIQGIQIPAYSLETTTYTEPKTSIIPEGFGGSTGTTVPSQVYTVNPEDFVVNTTVIKGIFIDDPEGSGTDKNLGSIDKIKIITNDPDGSSAGSKEVTTIDMSGDKEPTANVTDFGKTVDLTPDTIDFLRRTGVNLGDTTVFVDQPGEQEDNVFVDQPGDGSARVTGTIVTDTGEIIYYTPNEAGDEICLSVPGAEEGVCEQCFPVTQPVEVCEASTITVSQYDANSSSGSKIVQCLEENGTYLMTARFYNDAAKTDPINTANTKVHWKTTDPNGRFSNPTQGILPTREVTGSTKMFYSGGGTVTTKLIEVAGQDVEKDTVCQNIIEPCNDANVCGELTITSEPADPLEIGETALLTISGTDVNGNPLPGTTAITWVTDTGGNMHYNDQNQSNSKLEVTMKNSPLKFLESQQAGIVGAFIPKTDPLYSKACADQITVIDKAIPLVCEDLQLRQINSFGKMVPLDVLTPSTAYKLSSTATFNPADGTDTVSYSSNNGVFTPVPDFGNLVPGFMNNLPDAARQSAFEELMKNYILDANLSSGNYKNISLNLSETSIGINYPVPLGKTITVENGTAVFFFSFRDAVKTDNGLIVKTTNIVDEDCQKIVPMEVIPLVCIDLEVYSLSSLDKPSRLGTLESGRVYKLASIGEFNNELEAAKQTITYRSKFGAFAEVPSAEDIDDILSPIPEAERQLILEELIIAKLTAAEIDSQNYRDLEIALGPNTTIKLSSTLEVSNKKKVFFVTFADAETTQNALTVQVTTRLEEACQESFDLERLVIPKVPECINLEIITPKGTWKENDFTDNDEQKFEIEVSTNEDATIDDFEYEWTVSPSRAGDWSKGEITDRSDNNPLVNYLEDIDIDDEPTVTVQAIDPETGDEIQACADETELQIDEDDEEPEIEKFVYDTKGENWRNTINISGRTDDLSRWLDNDYRYVTYFAGFSVGSADSVNIWEDQLDEGSINSVNYTGEFEFEGIAIMIDSKKGDDYVLYRSEEFDEDRYNDEKIGSDNVSDYDDFDEDNDYYDEKYSCDNASSDVVCIENDIEDIDRDFRNGDKLEFRNTDKAENIYFIYQLENHTDISDENCKDIMSRTGSCGERFDNTIQFEGSKDNRIINSNDIDYEGDDSAKVIVICPFILTRQGGDVFFHSEVDTGIDVSQCTQVKSTPGVVVTPPPVERPYVPKTGAGDEIVFQTPTHDVCKLSNTEDAEQLAEYRNVLSNFSSSICELEAEVAEDWKETNITSAINANIEKIARFGTIANRDITLRAVSDLTTQGFSNLESGVFVIEAGDLTIDSRTGYMIKGTDIIPAAQTYIVIGGDLIINSNITYDDSSINPVDPNSFPSAAFIVVDGNIRISNDVTNLDGIFMAVDTDRSGEDGQLISSENTPTFENTLVVKGSLIGDVYNLFFNRRAIGDPLKDEAAITVRYDERILLNTPPGLQELIDIAQLRIAN